MYSYIQYNGSHGSWVWVMDQTLMDQMGHGSIVLTHGQLCHSDLFINIKRKFRNNFS